MIFDWFSTLSTMCNVISTMRVISLIHHRFGHIRLQNMQLCRMPKSTCIFHWSLSLRSRCTVFLFHQLKANTMNHSLDWTVASGNKYYSRRIKTCTDKRQRWHLRRKLTTTTKNQKKFSAKNAVIWTNTNHLSINHILRLLDIFFIFFIWSILLARASVYSPIYTSSHSFWHFIVQYASSCC